jgi:phosphoribosylglycinamide formyltransferase-1
MSNTPSCRLGILLSGRGSNFAAIQEAIEQGRLPYAEIAVVISNHIDAPGLTLAQSKGLTTVALEKSKFANRAAFDSAVAETLKAHQVQLVVLAGYDRILSQPVLEAYPQRILNIHPSLLPAYGGKGMVGTKVHQAVIEGQENTSGCTVHIVTDVVDGGAILGQRSIPVLESDTPELLAARVLEQEHQLYPQVIKAWIEKNILNKGQVDSHEHNALV